MAKKYCQGFICVTILDAKRCRLAEKLHQVGGGLTWRMQDIKANQKILRELVSMCDLGLGEHYFDLCCCQFWFCVFLWGGWLTVMNSKTKHGNTSQNSCLSIDMHIETESS